MDREIWKDIEGTDGDYQVSNLGRIKSRKKHRGEKQERIITLRMRKGYMTATLYKNTVGVTFLVHRLVAQAFIPNPENRKHVQHINGIKTDNRVENLEWKIPRKSIGGLQND